MATYKVEKCKNNDTLLFSGDESGSPGDKIFSIGVLIYPQRFKKDFMDAMNKLRVDHNFKWTAHYTGINERTNQFHRGLINLFFREKYLRFRANIFPGAYFRLYPSKENFVVPPSEYMYGQAYRGIIRHNLENCQKAVVYAEEKSKRRPKLFRDMIFDADDRVKDVMEGAARGHDGVQLCDLLLDAVCGNLRKIPTNQYKVGIQKHLLKKLKIDDFRERRAELKDKFKLWFYKKAPSSS